MHGNKKRGGFEGVVNGERFVCMETRREVVWKGWSM